MKAVKAELGLDHPQVSSRMNLHSLSRVVEMILSYLMIGSIYPDQ